MLTYLIGNDTFLRLLAGLSRLAGKRIDGLFLLYPAREEYADALAYRWHQRRFKWHPALVGVYVQNGNLGLIFGIPNLEAELRDEANASNVLGLMHGMERLRELVGAKRKIFAGILPSVFTRLGGNDSQLEQQREFTARAVVSALDDVIARCGLAASTPVLLIGGKGYLASKVFELCADRTRYATDVGEFDVFLRAANTLRNTPLIVINLAKASALSQYVPHFWPGVIVLNEVYPEPDARELDELSANGIGCFHIVGVRGTAWPRFPRAYRGGIPCCAALPEPGSTDVAALVTELVGHRPAASR